jgi:hypothetical protein
MVNYSELAKDVWISSPTAKSWLSLLVTSGLIVLKESNMSLFQFLASDNILDEVDNTHIEFISINDAIERNIEIADFILNDSEKNRDEKIIMICDSEELLYELEIKSDMYYSSDYAEEYSNKEYFYALNWRFTIDRSKQLYDYLIKQLEDVVEIEIWSIWLDSYESAKTRRISAKELTVEDLYFLDISKGFKYSECLVITKY